jgi:DNA-binding MarR family transcriptional regulator
VTELDRGLTSRILASLIAGGLIERTGSAEDARVFALKATGEGEALCARPIR